MAKCFYAIIERSYAQDFVTTQILEGEWWGTNTRYEFHLCSVWRAWDSHASTVRNYCMICCKCPSVLSIRGSWRAAHATLHIKDLLLHWWWGRVYSAWMGIWKDQYLPVRICSNLSYRFKSSIAEPLIHLDKPTERGNYMEYYLKQPQKNDCSDICPFSLLALHKPRAKRWCLSSTDW